ncbi:MAG: hypothetical protein CMO55_15490 [Verrucomicrobiales bacterium]|nr:hypothetical protein [Verrucomicrobiales bacterium]
MFEFPTSPQALLQELIRIPSVNPDGAPGQGATGEKDCAEWVGSFLTECGAAVQFEEVLEGRPNVIAHFPGRENKPGILFAPHTDTVSVQGMTVDPFGGVIEDGKIYGRGASDTKGTMAAMLWALHLMREEIPDLSAAVSFVGLMGEEAGQPGSKHFADKHSGEFEFAVVGEPTELETVYTHKGCVWLELTSNGKSCHGSTPQRGVNAIRRLTSVMEELLTRMESRLKNFPDPVLGDPTVSLGTIHGGNSTNIVPAQCRITLDFRETPAFYQWGGCRKLLSETLGKMGLEDAFEVTTIGDSTPLQTDPEIDGIQKLKSIGSKLTSAPWFCDAGRLEDGGIPAVAVGPGSIAQAHTKDEYLKVDDLLAGVEFYQQFLSCYR